MNRPSAEELTKAAKATLLGALLGLLMVAMDGRRGVGRPADGRR